MKGYTLIKNATVVTTDGSRKRDVLICEDRIVRVDEQINFDDAFVVDASNKVLLPGIIDAQVHFRDPGLTHKGDLVSESKAAIAGGVTTIIDMPNTLPHVLTPSILGDKYANAQNRSYCNYVFLLGLGKDNWKNWNEAEVKHLKALTDDGLYFAGPGNLLCQHPEALKEILNRFPDKVVALHCEDEDVIERNLIRQKEISGDHIPFQLHGQIRSEDACFNATSRCIEVASQTDGRLHVLHLTSGKETALFSANSDITSKRITTEVCVQNLYFSEEDYAVLGPRIKWNPSIKSKESRELLWQALLEDRIDLITTDHAPHTWEEKNKEYVNAMSGAPMIQHALLVMIDFYLDGKISLEKIVEKMCFNPAWLYQIERRGSIQEGYYADLVLLDLNEGTQVKKEDLHYACGWSPMEGKSFRSSVVSTWINGQLSYHNGQILNEPNGRPCE
jgi:dihydroorotase